MNRKNNNKSYLEQLSDATVTSFCPCGCASINLSVNGKLPTKEASLEILSDFLWKTENGDLNGVFVLAKENQLSGLEVWSIDGKETPSEIPKIEQLEPF